MAMEFSAVTYKDIGGLKKLVKQIQEFVELPLRHNELLQSVGIQPPNGVLIFGPHGSGKTLLARAAANEAGASVVVINACHIMNCDIEVSEFRIHNAFREAQLKSPSVLLIEDINLFMEKELKVYQLMCLLDELKMNSKAIVLIIGTVHSDGYMDCELKYRMFKKEVLIGAIGEVDRLEILRVHTKNMKLGEDVKLENIAKRTNGFVGGELAALCKEANLQCAFDALNDDKDKDGQIEALNSMVVTNKHFRIAMENIRSQLTLLESSMQTAPESKTNASESKTKVTSTTKEKEIAEVPNVSWDDIGGLENVKKELEESVMYPIKYPERYKKFGVSPSRGLLFYGPPGCGKTMLGKAIASMCNAKFISIKGSQLLSMWYGKSELHIRNLFKRARKFAPCILFFDELDSIANRRNSEVDDGYNCSDRVLNQLLAEMDGMDAKASVFVIGTTNRPQILDPAILRPGRLDQLVYIPLPDEASRYQIFCANTKKMPLANDVDLKAFSKLTEGFSGADIMGVCQHACRYAIREDIEKERKQKSSEECNTKTSNDEDNDKVREIKKVHFEEALRHSRRSVSDVEIQRYLAFGKTLNSQENAFQTRFSMYI